MVTEDGIQWLAGIVEGEGCINTRVCRTKRHDRVYEYIMPRLVVTMTDQDIVERVAKLFGVAPRLTEHREGKKATYGATVAGKPALEVMLRLFPYLGKRRRAKLNETLSKWEHA